MESQRVISFEKNEAAIGRVVEALVDEAVTDDGEYVAVARGAAALISTLLALGAFVFALRRRSMANGAAVFIAGGALTFIALAMNPWLWVPLDEYPVAITWALGIWALAAIAWAVLTVIARRRQRLRDF